MGNCASCGGCSGGCPGCGGCDRSLSLTAEEVAFLKRLGELPFLPVGRKREDTVPIFLEDGEEQQNLNSLVLQCLEKKNLVSLDYDQPLKGFRESWYLRCPVRGSVALTNRGQQVLEVLDYQGLL